MRPGDDPGPVDPGGGHVSDAQHSPRWSRRRGSRAHEAALVAGVELRPLPRFEDGERILQVMIATWGEHQLVPREMLRALGDSASPLRCLRRRRAHRVRAGVDRARPPGRARRALAHAGDAARSPAPGEVGVRVEARAGGAGPGVRGRGRALDVRPGDRAQRVAEPVEARARSRIGSSATTTGRWRTR